MRKQKYLTELLQHQNQLNQYAAKQLEYLDAQRKYQEAMINHQAGAAVNWEQSLGKNLEGLYSR